MTQKDIAYIRLVSQQLAATKFKNPKQLVSWMGAMQAQDYNMAKWAVGVRLPNVTDNIVQKALDRGTIIRTHLLRPTWHFAAAEDVHWMLSLSSPQIKRIVKSEHKRTELTSKIFSKSFSIIGNALQGHKHLPREEIKTLLQQSKIAVNETRFLHIMLMAEMEGIVCNGAMKGGKQTYALLDERVHKKKEFSRDEALALLATKYFSSHCPATLQDFVWWSGLLVADAKHALEMVKHKFISETINGKTYWFANSFFTAKVIEPSLYLLPSYDEYFISYTDRTASLKQKHHSRSFTSNGIFRPVILLNGQGVGIWKRTADKDKLRIEADFFSVSAKKTAKAFLKNEAERLRCFMGMKTMVLREK